MDTLLPSTTIKFERSKVSFRKIGEGKRKILFFHGFPGSSIQIYPFTPFLKTHDLQVLCLDRPGYNESEVSGNDQLVQTTQDAYQLVTHLGWEQFEVMSVSGGTPFLFHFVKAHPFEVQRITIISGLGSVFSAEFSKTVNLVAKLLLRILPFIPTEFLYRLLPIAEQKKKSKFNIMEYLLPTSEADLMSMGDPIVQEVLALSFQEAFKQKGLGPKRDAKAYASKWSVNLGHFVGPISVWHGEEDRVICSSTAQILGRCLPKAKTYLIPNEGHFSLAINRVPEILESSSNI